MRVAALALIIMLQGCSTMQDVLGRDPRDAPWDPKPGQNLFDQIPNNDNSAASICCGHLRTCKPHQSPRC
jgi:hypothetical protein